MKKLSRLLYVSAGMLLLSAPLWTQPTAPSKAGVAVNDNRTSQTWTGTLVDADCKPTAPNTKCEITEDTKSFGLQTSDGTLLKFDDNGNEKVRAALQVSGKKGGSVAASVTGSLEGDLIKVESVQIS